MPRVRPTPSPLCPGAIPCAHLIESRVDRDLEPPLKRPRRNACGSTSGGVAGADEVGHHAVARARLPDSETVSLRNPVADEHARHACDFDDRRPASRVDVAGLQAMRAPRQLRQNANSRVIGAPPASDPGRPQHGRGSRAALSSCGNSTPRLPQK